MGVTPVLRAIVFDFDGLILDTEEPIYRSWLEVYTAHGQELPFDRWMQTVGSSNAAFDPGANLEQRLGRALTQEVLDERMRRRTELVLEQAVLPGVAELAAAARDIGLKTGVASSSSQIWVCSSASGAATTSSWSSPRRISSWRRSTASVLRPVSRSRSRTRPTACSPPRRRGCFVSRSPTPSPPART